MTWLSTFSNITLGPTINTNFITLDLGHYLLRPVHEYQHPHGGLIKPNGPLCCTPQLDTLSLVQIVNGWGALGGGEGRATSTSIVKHFFVVVIEVKENDPEALRLLDEIARCMAKDLKMYGRCATSFLPQLLSFAAVVRENSKGSVFESVPDWTSITDDNPCIKSHPHFDKTIDYHPSSLNDLSTNTVTADLPTTLTMPTTTALPSTQAVSTSMSSLMDSDVIAGTKKRKPTAEDTDEAIVVPTNTLPSPSILYVAYMAMISGGACAFLSNMIFNHTQMVCLEVIVDNNGCWPERYTM
ncbi:hypothetical protein BDR06DRAFT_977794 [Suillus hirtellus]|nr:hypothetical protein BDR06DRAFT_977794 [Suillus hirtellus]